MFKRNQIDFAISRLTEPGAQEPSSQLKTRIKRLLETDRALGCNPRSNDVKKVNYAFFRKAAPGSGFEVWFSNYEAFALLLGLQLMHHNWPQGFAVSVLREVRKDLEKEHKRILRLDPGILFDEKAIAQALQPGAPAFDTIKPAFLVIVSHHGISPDQERAAYACSIHSNLDSGSDWVARTIKGVGGGSSMFELTVAAHALARELERTNPRPRGRSG
jgi:hypothetical protein